MKSWNTVKPGILDSIERAKSDLCHANAGDPILIITLQQRIAALQEVIEVFEREPPGESSPAGGY